MRDPVKLAVAGAGLVGQRHIAAIASSEDAILTAVVEPSTLQIDGAHVFSDLAEMIDAHPVDGVILSTPTNLHVEGALHCIARGIPVLVEKPMAATAAEAAEIANASVASGVPVLVGHHRRHNPIIQKAAALIKEGAIGDVRVAQSTCWFYKPDDYFETAPWRTRRGAGPISVNLVHDIDLIRHLCGEIVSVQAQMAQSRRGFENEDLAAAVLRFENGAICTVSVSDSVVAPWSWEMTSGEYPIYSATDQSCYLIGGSEGSLSIPDMRLWRHDGDKSWWNAISATTAPRAAADPLINQINHFAQVIRGAADPLISAQEGLRTMQVIEAIQAAARTQTLVHITASSDGVANAAE